MSPCRSGIVVWFSVINTIRMEKSAEQWQNTEQRCFAVLRLKRQSRKFYLIQDILGIFHNFIYVSKLESKKLHISTCNIQNHTKYNPNSMENKKVSENFQSTFLRQFSSFVCRITFVNSNSFGEQRKQQSTNNSNVYSSDYYWEPLKVIKTTWLSLFHSPYRAKNTKVFCFSTLEVKFLILDVWIVLIVPRFSVHNSFDSSF